MFGPKQVEMKPRNLFLKILMFINIKNGIFLHFLN